MNRTLSQDFADGRTRRITRDGAEVWAMLEFSVPATSSVGIERIRATVARPQGLRLQAAGGDLVANGVKAKAIVVWADTAPETVTIECVVKKGRTAVVKVWNVWRDEGGAEHAWIGNCGMTIRDDGDAYDLGCSDGWGDPDFDDLRLRLSAPQWALEESNV